MKGAGELLVLSVIESTHLCLHARRRQMLQLLRLVDQRLAEEPVKADGESLAQWSISQMGRMRPLNRPLQSSGSTPDIFQNLLLSVTLSS